MSTRPPFWPTLLLLGMCSGAVAAPMAGRDYYSIQIASGDAALLQRLYRTSLDHQQYARLEARNGKHLLRIGFWDSRREAEQALPELKKRFPSAYVRLAAYHPEQIALKNWPDEAARPEPTVAAKPAVTTKAAVAVEPPADPAPPSTPPTPPADGALIPGRDYYSIQLISGDSRLLEKLFRHSLRGEPYARVEERGGQHMLRVGFWDSRHAAEQALPRFKANFPSALVRVASYRPDKIALKSWQGTAVQAGPTPVPAPAPAPALPPEPAAALPGPRPAEKPSGMRPYNEEDYQLAFQVFLGNRNLEDAFKVASAAVAQVPGNLAWRRKLAQVSDWTQRPGVAFQNWSYLLDHGTEDDEVIKSVLRLAPFAAGQEEAIRAWLVIDRSHPLSPEQWQAVYDLYEQAGKQMDGARFFESRYKETHDTAQLERAAQLYQRGGDDDDAIRCYGSLFEADPTHAEWGVQAALLQLNHDRFQEALQLLSAHRAQVPHNAETYWNLLADIAWRSQQDATAADAYRVVVQSDKARVDDFLRLVLLLRDEHPREAADAARTGFMRLGDIRLFQDAANLYSDLHDLGGLRQLLFDLPKERLAELQSDPRFLRARAEYYRASGQPTLAWGDMSRALDLAPQDTDTIIAALWLLIDMERAADLRRLAQRADRLYHDDPTFWLPLAAAYDELDMSARTIKYFERALKETPNDLLLMLNYADALERGGQAGMAMRVRRHAWLKLREKYPNPDLMPPLSPTPDMLATARLALMNKPGDPALAGMRALIDRLTALPPEKSDDQQTNDLILGWAIGTDQDRNAKAWMWQRYARGRQSRVPAWGEIETALRLHDTATMDRLLIANADALPVRNRFDAAYELEHWPMALSTAFHGMEANPTDAELYQRYMEKAPLHANYGELTWTKRHLGNLRQQISTARLSLQATRRLRLDLEGASTDQALDDELAGPLAPTSDREKGIGLTWMRNRGDTQFQVQRHRELTGYTSWKIGQDYELNGSVDLSASYAHREPADDTTALQLAGSRDRLAGSVQYRFSKREYVTISPSTARYYTQYGDYLGKGGQVDMELGYRARTEYPDWNARLIGTTAHYTADGTVQGAILNVVPPADLADLLAAPGGAAGYFIPETYHSYGVCAGMGQYLRDTPYSRAWRPFFEYCSTHHSIYGTGFATEFGIVGSVDGEDRLTLRFDLSSDGQNSGGGYSRVWTLGYRRYY